MKNIYLITAVIFCLAISCKNAAQSNNNDEETSTSENGKSKNVSSRDVSITPAVSYSDLFLDSAVVANYLNTVDMDKKLKRRMLSFYNTRNYQFAWFASDGITEQARGFYNLYSFDASHKSDSLQIDKKLQTRMDNLFAAENMKVNQTDKSVIDTELKLTRLFIEHGLEVYEDGYVKRKEMERFVPYKKVEAIPIADSLLTKKHKDNKYFEDINEPYKRLKQELGRYVQIAKNGGWPTITATEANLKFGSVSPVITTIKERLRITGDLAVRDTTPRFDSALVQAVKSFQGRFGYTQTGAINKQLIKDMNVPVETVIQQLLINLDRMRWLAALPEGRMILVNIPEFMMHVMEGKNKVFDMNVVVGKQGHNTMMFTDDLRIIDYQTHTITP